MYQSIDVLKLPISRTYADILTEKQQPQRLIRDSLQTLDIAGSTPTVRYTN